MNVAKAIEIKLNPKFGSRWPMSKDEIEADRLSIEALKYYQQERERRGATKTMWLPGETKD